MELENVPQWHVLAAVWFEAFIVQRVRDQRLTFPLPESTKAV